MEFPMYKLIDTIKEYQQTKGRDPDMETITGWANHYVNEEKDFYYEKPCSKALTYIMMFSIYLLGILTSLIVLSFLA